jgi:hypothetical protein
MYIVNVLTKYAFNSEYDHEMAGNGVISLGLVGAGTGNEQILELLKQVEI